MTFLVRITKGPINKTPNMQIKPDIRVLCIFSKIFEKILEQQLSDVFENIFNPYLCAFRRGLGCQTTLLRLLEDWRNALEKNQYVAAVLMDLSMHILMVSFIAVIRLSIYFWF